MRRTKEDAQKTKDDILNAAVKLFAENGVANTSLEDIAKTAKVTRGAVYWHFKNKADIFDALHQRLYQPLTDMILQDMEVDHPDPLQQMEDLCIELLLDVERNLQKRQAMTLFMLKCNYSGDLAQYKCAHMAKKEDSLKLFSRYFIKAQKKARLSKNADVNTLTLAIRFFMKGIVTEYMQQPDKFKMSQQAPKLIKLFFNGLKA